MVDIAVYTTQWARLVTWQIFHERRLNLCIKYDASYSKVLWKGDLELSTINQYVT